MPNTLGTTNGALIAQRTLETLLAKFPMLSLISTDFSGDSVKWNQQVTSRVVVPGTAKDYNTTTGYVADDRTTVDVPVTINKHKHHTYGVNDQERSSTDRNLIQEFADSSAHALGKVMMDDLFALITVANFTLSYSSSAANFDRDDIVKIRTKLNVENVPDLNRFMVLNSSYYEGPSIDSTIVANAGSSSDTVKTGVLPNIHGFTVAEYSALPDNSENLQGIAGNKEALVIATRLPEQPSTPVPGLITSVREPHTGLSLQLRQWYDMTLGKEFRTMTLMYGVASGLSNTAENKRLVRITT